MILPLTRVLLWAWFAWCLVFVSEMDIGTLGNTLISIGVSLMQDPRIGFSEAHAIHPTHLVCLVACTSEAYCETEKKNSRFSQVFGGVFSACLWVLSLNFAVLQMCVCVCVERGHTCAYTKLTFHLHHAWHNRSVFTCTLVWLFIRKTHLSLPDTILALVSMD